MAPRLLVLGDERDLLFLSPLILEPEGFDVPMVASRCEQVTVIEYLQTDLLLLGEHLHRRSRAAEALWHQWKASQPTVALPVILSPADVHTLSDEQDFLRAYHVGGTHTIRCCCPGLPGQLDASRTSKTCVDLTLRQLLPGTVY